MSPKPGFYVTDSNDYYVSRSGRIYIIATDDDLGSDAYPDRESLPPDAEEISQPNIPEHYFEAAQYCEAREKQEA